MWYVSELYTPKKHVIKNLSITSNVPYVSLKMEVRRGLKETYVHNVKEILK